MADGSWGVTWFVGCGGKKKLGGKWRWDGWEMDGGDQERGCIGLRTEEGQLLIKVSSYVSKKLPQLNFNSFSPNEMGSLVAWGVGNTIKGSRPTWPHSCNHACV